MRFSWVALCAALCVAAPAWACRQALVLALDVSGSVDGVEYQQQVSGLAFALGHPEIRASILSDVEHPIAISVFEWSSQNHQYIILPWTRLDSASALDRAISEIEKHRKVRAGLKTAMGTALDFGRMMLEKQGGCWQHTIDVSGDGPNNFGPAPQRVYERGFERVRVNALAVGNPKAASGEGPGIEPDALLEYFESEVIKGAGSFALIANGYADYARAMKLKLAKELEPPIVSEVRGQGGRPG